MAYQVKLEVFEGPFDLLLHLISKRELDVYEVSLAQITEEYLDHLRGMQDFDLEIATEFLVVAATLIEIKASRLLPGPPSDDEDALALSSRDMLIAKLLEYRAFKDAGVLFLQAIADNVGYIGRSAGPGREFDRLCPDLLARVSPVDLATLAARALLPKPVPTLDLSHISPIRATVAEAVSHVLRELAKRRSISFDEIVAGCKSRIDVVVRFLAVLELVKSNEVEVRQKESFGEISLSRRGDVGVVVDLAIDEYESVGGDAR
ncbi:MAG: segregation/condensation protein A [Actinomycetota bacterium]